jgi:predicted RNA-binding protein with RPS1 domain
VSDEFVHEDWDRLFIDDYIRVSNLEKDLTMKVQLSLKRIEKR